MSKAAIRGKSTMYVWYLMCYKTTYVFYSRSRKKLTVKEPKVGDEV